MLYFENRQRLLSITPPPIAAHAPLSHYRSFIDYHHFDAIRRRHYCPPAPLIRFSPRFRC